MNNNPYNSDDLFENDENNIKENEQHTYNSETDDDTVVYTPKRSVGSGNIIWFSELILFFRPAHCPVTASFLVFDV